MSTIGTNAEDLILNADGSGSDIKFKSNGTEVGSISDGGVMTATSFAGSGAALTGVGVAGISSSADATAITIDSSENVGIGTTSPSSPLHLSAVKNDGWVAQLLNTGTGSDANGVLIKAGVDDADLILRLQQADGGAILDIKHDGRGLSQFTAKAWANWNGTGTPAFRDSHNCSSLTDVSTGNYRVNFSNNMANTNYCPVANGNAENTWAGAGTHANGIEVAYVAIYHVENNTSTDTSINNVLVFGD